MARIGAAPLSVCESINDFTIGERTIPPTDNPELAAAIADARFVWNHLVTTVVASVSPLDDHAMANNP
jgi:hypothetical protein